MNLTTIEDAFHALVVATTGIAADNVLWARQRVSRPVGLWASLGPLNINPVGLDWYNVEDNHLTLADDDVEAVSTVNDTLQLTAHAYQTGDGPVRPTTTGTLPAPLALATDYWVVVVDANNIKLATSFQDAVAASPTVVDLTTAGSGTHTISDTATTARAGQEVLDIVRGRRSYELTIQCYGAEATGSARPASVLNDLVVKSMLPSNRSILVNAGISITRFNQVQEFELFLGQEVESRGLLLFSGYLAEEVSETGTYIEIAVPVEDPPIT